MKEVFLVEVVTSFSLWRVRRRLVGGVVVVGVALSTILLPPVFRA